MPVSCDRAGDPPGWRARARPGRRRAVKWILVGGLLAVLGLSLSRTVSAARAADRGRDALLEAEAHLAEGRPRAAGRSLDAAGAAFGRVSRELGGLGPLLSLAKVTPLVRVQVRALGALADAGILVSRAGLKLTDAASGVVDPVDRDRPFLWAGLGALRGVEKSLAAGVGDLDTAIARVASLDGYRLIGPLGGARQDLGRRLPRARERLVAARQGVAGFLTFAGESGPRRWLVLSQNPDEVRPTGGYIGTYGVLAAAPGRLFLERYDSTESWYEPRPHAAIPPEEAPSAFRVPDPPVRQTLANVNHTPDWPRAARLALELWQRGGEAPVDGVISLTPDFLSRLLTILGPVELTEYGERITASNLVARTDYHTHLEGAELAGPANRKRFVAVLAKAVLERLLAAPASSWRGLAGVAGEGFESREAMMWSSDPAVGGPLARAGWEGSLPHSSGDFFYGAEFEYMAKNGRGLRRTYDHHVSLRADGSARITTKITIANQRPFSPEHHNIDSASYITLYGPEGAVLGDSSDPAVAREPPIAGHPAAAWFRAAPPLGSTSLRAVWEAPAIALRQEDGTWRYHLRFMRVPAHSGDVLRLRVDLPPGWRWDGPSPPQRVKLTKDLVGSWSVVAEGGAV